jgi:hypothetical protein
VKFMTIQRFFWLPRHACLSPSLLPHFLRAAAVAVLVLSAAGCGMQLRPEPVNGATSSIAGQWQLQSPSRTALADSMRAVMARAQAKQDKRDRQDMRRRPEPEMDFSPPASEPDADNRPPPGHDPHYPRWEARERREQQEALLNAILPSDKLQIVQSLNRIEFVPYMSGRRRFDKAVPSILVTQFANFKIESGWQANVFVVHSRDAEQRIDIVERYQRVGDRLHMQVEFSIPDAKDQVFIANYVLATS